MLLILHKMTAYMLEGQVSLEEEASYIVQLYLWDSYFGA